MGRRHQRLRGLLLVVARGLRVERPVDPLGELDLLQHRDVVAAVSKAGGLGALAAVGHSDRQLEIDLDWIQDNQSFSAAVGTVRGLHFQVPPVGQDKLVRVLRGAIYDVAVDIRKGSPTYGKWVGVELSAEKWNQLLVPIGFAHCFMTIQPDTEVLYKVSGPYSKEHEGAIRWNDPALGIDWPDTKEKFGVEPTLSDKDEVAPFLADFDSPFSCEG